MIQNLISGFFFFFFFFGLLFCFREYNFLYSSSRFSGHCQSFLWVFDFLVKSLKSQQKLAKMITTYFTIYLCSKNLTNFTNLNSLDIENNMLLQHSQKPFSLYKFSSQHFSVWCQKKYLPCINSSCPRTAYSRDVVAFYLAWRGWIISLGVARCLSL